MQSVTATSGYYGLLAVPQIRSRALSSQQSLLYIIQPPEDHHPPALGAMRLRIKSASAALIPDNNISAVTVCLCWLNDEIVCYTRTQFRPTHSIRPSVSAPCAQVKGYKSISFFSKHTLFPTSLSTLCSQQFTDVFHLLRANIPADTEQLLPQKLLQRL